MINKKCEGCSGRFCDTRYNDGSCPCTKCVVKSMCETFDDMCSKYKIWIEKKEQEEIEY